MHKLVIAVLLFVCAALPAAAGPKIERIKTPLGIEVWFVREPSIPIISLQATWRGGSSSDPAGQEGLAQLVTGLLNEGAGDLSADEFQIALQEDAIDMGFGADRDYTTVTLRTLTRNRTRAFELLKLALTAPRFDQALALEVAQGLHGRRDADAVLAGEAPHRRDAVADGVAAVAQRVGNPSRELAVKEAAPRGRLRRRYSARHR